MNEKRINKMEKDLDIAIESITRLKNDIELYKKDKEKIYELSKYYGSKAWFKDKNDYEKNNKRIKAGVLGEDIPYDILIDMHNLALEMIELGKEYLNNE